MTDRSALRRAPQPAKKGSGGVPKSAPYLAAEGLYVWSPARGGDYCEAYVGSPLFRASIRHAIKWWRALRRPSRTRRGYA